MRSKASSCAVSIGKADAQHSRHRLEPRYSRTYGVAVTVAAFGAHRRVLSDYWLAWFATLTFFVGFYALLVPLPRYLLAIGLADWQIGFVLGAFGIASLIGRPLAGLATDHFGSRPVLLAGAASLAVGALGVPATTNLTVLLPLRLLQAAGYVAFTTAGTALVVTLVPSEVRARRLAVFGAAANVAISLTPAAIGALLTLAPISAGLFASAACATFGGIVALALPNAGPRDDRARGMGADPPFKRGWVGGSAPRVVWLPMLATGLLGAGFAAFFQFAPILAERRDVSSGVLYTIYGASIIATRLFGGRLLDGSNVWRIVALSAIVMAVGHGLVAATETAWVVFVAPVLVAASGGLFHPALLAHHAALLPGTPGRASAAFYVAFDLGIGLGSWLFGLMLQVAGLPGLYWTACALALAVLPLTATRSSSLARAPAAG
jgi:predicted MFS family arabinose efflux permease